MIRSARKLDELSPDFLLIASPLNLIDTVTIRIYGGAVRLDSGNGTFSEFQPGLPTTIMFIPTGEVRIQELSSVSRIELVTDSFSSVTINGPNITSIDDLVNGNTAMSSLSLITGGIVTAQRAFKGITLINDPLTSNMANCSDIRELYRDSSINALNAHDFGNVRDFRWAFAGLTLPVLPIFNYSSGIIFTSMLEGTTTPELGIFNTANGETFNRMFANMINLVCMESVDTSNSIAAVDMFINTPLLVAPSPVEQLAIMSNLDWVNADTCPPSGGGFPPGSESMMTFEISNTIGVVRFQSDGDIYVDWADGNGFISYTGLGVGNDRTLVNVTAGMGVPIRIRQDNINPVVKLNATGSQVTSIIVQVLPDLLTADSMFAFSPNLVTLDLSGLDTSNCLTFVNMFSGLQLNSIDVENVIVTSVATSIRGMFTLCPNITELDIDHWNTINVTDHVRFVNGCTSLQCINRVDTRGSGPGDPGTDEMFADTPALFLPDAAAQALIISGNLHQNNCT